jgi:peptidoglycan/LPS O-acetylase OafA/YrhL
MAALVAVMVLPVPMAMLWQSLLIAAVIAGTTLNPDTPVARLLETAPPRWIGRISYSLYLWQNLFLIPLGVAWHLGLLQTLPLNIAAAFAAAALSYYVVERPMIKLGHRLAPPTTEGRA